MELTYASVTQFFVDLKALLLGSGMTVSRTVGDTDVVLDAGGGTFIRLQKKVVSPSVVAIGFDYGTDPDLLSVADTNPERFMPFAVVDGRTFAPTTFWVPDEKFLAFLVVGENDSKRYRIDLRIAERQMHVFHQDRFNPQYQPNFKDTGGPYLSAGA